MEAGPEISCGLVKDHIDHIEVFEQISDRNLKEYIPPLLIINLTIVKIVEC